MSRLRLPSCTYTESLLSESKTKNKRRRAGFPARRHCLDFDGPHCRPCGAKGQGEGSFFVQIWRKACLSHRNNPVSLCNLTRTLKVRPMTLPRQHVTIFFKKHLPKQQNPCYNNIQIGQFALPAAEQADARCARHQIKEETPCSTTLCLPWKQATASLS